MTVSRFISPTVVKPLQTLMKLVDTCSIGNRGSREGQNGRVTLIVLVSRIKVILGQVGSANMGAERELRQHFESFIGYLNERHLEGFPLDC